MIAIFTDMWECFGFVNQSYRLRLGVVWYGILGFNVPLDTV